MKFHQTDLADVIVVEPEVFPDSRGFFFEAYNKRKLATGGIFANFVQDNHSRSVLGTVRGLHAQRLHPQAKLIRVLHGAIFDVVVDIRRGSPNFRRWISAELSSSNHRMCFVPEGYAHGFCVTSEYAEVEYKSSDFYDPCDELRIAWNDPTIKIAWPTTEVVLSEKDMRAARLDELSDQLPRYPATT